MNGREKPRMAEPILENGTDNTLDRITKDRRVRVLSIEGGWGARHRLNRLGIHPGDTILVKRGGIMGGPILIQIHGMEVALGRGMARKVVVTDA